MAKYLKDILRGSPFNLESIDPNLPCKHCGTVLSVYKYQNAREHAKNKDFNGLCSLCVQYLTKNIDK